MDTGESKELIISFFRKFRWAAAVILAGMLLMLLPQGNTDEAPDREPEADSPVTLEQQLETILSAMEGAGRVRVLLTEASGERLHYQVDQAQRNSGDSSDRTSDTVIITDRDRAEQGLVRQKDPPVYRGAVVLCQGADSARVRLAMVDAVATATGLTSDKIAVLKMK